MKYSAILRIKERMKNFRQDMKLRKILMTLGTFEDILYNMRSVCLQE